MNKTLLLFLIFVIQSISAQKSEKHIKIADATSQEWFSGAPGGRTGTYYSIKIYVSTDKKIKFTNVWLGKENIPFEEEFFTQNNNEIKKGDSLLLTYNRIYNHIYNPVDTGTLAKRVPIDYKGDALIECIIDKRAEYFIVKDFRKLEPLKGR